MNSRAEKMRAVTWRGMASIATSVLLTACGGGGGGDLKVTFSYPMSEIYGYPVWTPLTISATLYGLSGNVPNCAVTAGRLPGGVNVDPSTCALSGTPNEAGSFPFTVSLSVPDYSGSISTSNTLRIDTPPIYYGQQPITTGLSWGKTSSSTPTLYWTGYQPTGTDMVGNFRLSDGGQLPLGLSLDANSGTISGTLRGFGSLGFTVLADATHNGHTVVLTSDRIVPTMNQTELTYDASSVSNGRVGQAYNLSTPIFVEGHASITSEYIADFEIAPARSVGEWLCGNTPIAPLPVGLTLNRATGAISGIPNATYSGCVLIQFTIFDALSIGTSGFLVAPVSILP